MKTKEFREAIEKFAKVRGFTVEENSGYIKMWESYSEGMVVDVEIGVQYAIDTIGTGFESLEPDAREHLMNYIVLPYMKTPLEEREEEKKYVYRMNCAVVAQEYLKATKKGVVRFEGDRDFSTNEPYFKSEFTDAEVENYPKEVRELFKICEKIEVTSND